jgi:hypothetical protein
MRKADLLAGLFLLAFGIIAIYIVIPNQISGIDAAGLPPRGMPLVTAAAVTVLSFVLVVRSILRKRADDAPFPIDRRDAIGVLVGLGVTILGTIIFSVAGFIAAGLFVVVSLMLWMGERQLRRLVVVPPVAVGLLYVFVTQLLRVTVP